MTRLKKQSPEVEGAYNSIAEFFSAFSLASARSHLRHALKAASGSRYWKGSPANALYFFEKLRQLVGAARIIHRTGGIRPAALLALAADEAPDLTQYRQYCGWHRPATPWHFFPRCLNSKEYANPYTVFAKAAALGSKKEWKHWLKEWRYYTLSNSRLTDWLEDVDALKLFALLCKLVEAAHLVEVRAIEEIGGEPRPKWKEPQPPASDHQIGSLKKAVG